MPTRLQIELSTCVSAAPITVPRIRRIWQVIQQTIPVRPHWTTLSVVVVGDKHMKQLNTRYRGQATVTDVLSFPYGKEGGEIVLCYPQARRQARQKQVGVQQEVNWLLVHGLLHLLGYDHERTKDAQIMRPLEQQILAYV